MLASCAKTTVVYNEAPEEIGFKAVTGVMTKVEDGTQMPATMGVFAYNNSVKYFENISYEDKSGYWGATNDNEKSYWPVNDDVLTFTVYAPHQSSGVSYDNGEKTTTIAAVDNSESQIDWLYGTTQPEGKKSTHKDSNVGVTLGHALSQLVFNFTANTNDVVTLTSVSLNKTRQNEKCDILYENKELKSVTWTQTGSKTEAIEVLASSSNVALSNTAVTYHKLVVPTMTLSEENMVFTYKLAGSDAELTYTVNTSQLGTTWEYGKRYIYNIEIGVSEIKFNPTVTAWDADFDDDLDTTDDDKDITL